MTQPDTIAVAALFALPAFSRAQISANGHLVAYLEPWRGRLNLFIATIYRGTDGLGASRRLPSSERRNVEGFGWTPDAAGMPFVSDENGDENWHLRSVAVGEDDPTVLDLTPDPACG